jgi:hypothetical protein
MSTDTGCTKLEVHSKDRALFERIDSVLGAFKHSRAEPVPTHLRRYADEVDRWHAEILAARRARGRAR